MPMITVAAKNVPKLFENTVSNAPPIWPAAASRMIVPMPSTSHKGPPRRMARPNPQNAAPRIHPTCTSVSDRRRCTSPMMSPRTANDIAVAMSARQLALKSRVRFTVP